MNRSMNAALDTYEIYGAVHVQVEQGSAQDYAHMRAKQLSALLHMTYGGGEEAFQTLSSELQNNYLWLASSIADELGNLLPLVAKEARAMRGSQ
jgi:hypothetical protein